MCIHKGIGHSQEPTHLERGLRQLLQDLYNPHATIYGICEKCDNPIIKPLKLCSSCTSGVISGTINKDDFYCTECKTWYPDTYMIETRARGCQINRCKDCARRHELEYE